MRFSSVISITLILLFCSVGCTRRIVVVQEAAPTTPVAVVAPDAAPIPPVAEAVGGQETVIASIRKTACFGSCPVFEVQVKNDGTIDWNGKQYVERLGKYRTLASKEWVENLVRYAQEQGFFNFLAHYPADGKEIADIPHTICTLQRGAIRHTVDNGGDAPTKLRQFEDFFISKLEELRWEKK